MIRRALSLLLALLLTAAALPALAEATAAPAEEAALTPYEFAEGFSLSLPEGWLRYPVSDAQAEKGLAYLLSDGEGLLFLAVSHAPTELATLEELASALREYDRVSIPAPDACYVTYVDGTAFGGAALVGGEVWSFLFTGAEDPDYLPLATEILSTLTLAEEEGE